MVEPTQRDVDHDLDASRRLFERARVGEVAPIEPRRPQRLLLALDGSAQDLPSLALASGLGERFGCTTVLVDARELPGAGREETDEQGVAAADLARQWSTVLEAAPVEALPKPSGDSFQQILDSMDQARPDLLIVPSPFGRDLEAVGPDSTGTVIDVLLARSPVPLLVVRQPFTPQGPLFGQVQMLLGSENEAAPAAAAWAAGLVAPGGQLQLVLALEAEFYENVSVLLQVIDPTLDISPEELANALAHTHARLHRGLQKVAVSLGFRYQLRVERQGQPAAPVIADEALPSAAHPLIVLPLERSDRASQGRIHDRIRFSPHPLLVVPG